MSVRFVCVNVILVVAVFDVIAKNRTKEPCGIQSLENQYPWLASIEYEYTDEPKTRIHCTGALVSKKHVVSNALCFDRDVFLGLAKSVRLGLHNSNTGGICTEVSNDDNCTNSGTLTVPIEKVTIDPEYSNSNWAAIAAKDHDIALITLRDVVPYTDNIRPICLPTADVTQSAPTQGTAPDRELYVTGISDNDPNNYKILEAALTYLDKAKCEESMQSHRIRVADDNFCAKIIEGINPCLVRSFINGGVLMNKRRDSFELVGLGIFEASCSSSFARNRIFTHIFLYLDWIRSKITEKRCGIQVSENHYPWLAAIELKYRDEPIQIVCSGALVSRRHVVCNAECFHRSMVQGMMRSVRLGPHNFIIGRNCTGDTSSHNCTVEGGIRIPIKAVIQHPEFTRSFKITGIHDIALAILSEMVTYSDVIRPICLPSVDVTLLAASGRELYVNELYYEGPLSDTKLRASMTYVDKEGCREVLDNYDMVLADDLMCATKADDVTNCFTPGDLLINKRGDNYELVGLVQLSYCGTTKVFTNVFRSLDWIRSVIPEWTHGCGRRKVEHVELIINGESSKVGDWPWHVAIYRREKLKKNYICGGTLISKKMVLTAAHCTVLKGETVNPGILSVDLGKYNLIGRDSQSQERQVQTVIVHEDFAQMNYLHNDIALLKLRIDATYNDYVQPACIWSSDTHDSLPSDRDIGTVVGWGFDESNALSSQLKQANAPKVSDVTCIKKNPLFYVNVLSNNKKFCAGWANGTSPCNGDSGGGFFVFIPDTPNTDPSNTRGSWYVRGIVSMTPALRNYARCDPNQYVVFTDLGNYTDWIQTHLVY